LLEQTYIDGWAFQANHAILAPCRNASFVPPTAIERRRVVRDPATYYYAELFREVLKTKAHAQPRTGL
jgi:hypothetical protein